MGVILDSKLMMIQRRACPYISISFKAIHRQLQISLLLEASSRGLSHLEHAVLRKQQMFDCLNIAVVKYTCIAAQFKSASYEKMHLGKGYDLKNIRILRNTAP